MTDPIEALRSALVGSYEIGREIGQGGFATVYLAGDLKHDRPVAIKVLSASEHDPLRRSARFAAIVRRVGLDVRIFTSPTGGRPQ